MKLLLVPLLFAAVAQPGNDPEKLFRAMEEKIAKADNVHLVFEGTLQEGKEKGKGKGKLTFAKGGKANLDLSLDFGGQSMKMGIVSNGTKMWSSGDGKGKVEDTPKDFAKELLTTVTTYGVVPGMLMGVSTVEIDGKEKVTSSPFIDLKLTGFKLSKAEQVNGKDAVVVEYRVNHLGAPKEGLHARVWIDPKTLLPLKRSMSGPDGKDAMIETYSEFRVNQKLDPKLFEQPK